MGNKLLIDTPGGKIHSIRAITFWITRPIKSKAGPSIRALKDKYLFNLHAGNAILPSWNLKTT